MLVWAWLKTELGLDEFCGTFRPNKSLLLGFGVGSKESEKRSFALFELFWGGCWSKDKEKRSLLSLEVVWGLGWSIESEKISSSFPTTYDDIIKEASNKYSVPEDLIKAVIKQESNYMPNAVSHKGAVGLMQIMPSTGVGLGVTDKEMLKDPYTNIMAGTKYLSQMLNRYDGRLDLSLSAYNAGPSLVDKLQRIPNIEETKNYVKNIIGYIK